jgi:hypothetical protein
MGDNQKKQLHSVSNMLKTILAEKRKTALKCVSSYDEVVLKTEKTKTQEMLWKKERKIYITEAQIFTYIYNCNFDKAKKSIERYKRLKLEQMEYFEKNEIQLHCMRGDLSFETSENEGAYVNYANNTKKKVDQYEDLLNTMQRMTNAEKLLL